DVARTLAARSVFGHRAVVTGAGRAELLSGLGLLAAGKPAANVVSGLVPAGGPGRVGFLFSGQGSQRAGMAAGLHAASPVFAAAFDEAAALLGELLGVPVAEVALGRGPGGADDPRADETGYAQPCLFALQAGLVAVLRSCGITADAVAGHSVGEVAAAYAAGVLGLKDACVLVAARARGMQALPAGGAMCAVAAAERDVAAFLDDGARAGSGQPDTAGDGARLDAGIAAVNGPAAVVISGDDDAVRAVAEEFAGRGARTRMLRVSHAFHSARMDPVLADLERAAAGLPHAAPRVPWAGALHGELVTEPGPAYWAAAARHPVRFADAVAALAAEGVRTFIEIGPDGTLSALGPAAADGGPAVFIPVQRPGTAAADALLAALGRAHVAGVAVDWTSVLAAGEPAELPTYAFQRQRFWTRPGRPAAAAAAGGPGAATAAEGRFWTAVEDGDLAAVAGTLAVDPRLPLNEALPALSSWRRRERATAQTAGWRYRIDWVPAPPRDPAGLAGRWLVVTPAAESLAGWCAAALSAHGARVAVVEADPAGSRAALGRAVAQVLGDEPAAGVVSLLALREAPLDGLPGMPAGLAGSLTLVQALGDLRVPAPLWVLTRGAVATGPGEPLTSPVQAQAWGFGRVAALEHPDHGGGLIDLPPAPDEQTAAQLAAVLASPGEDQVALRRPGILARRLVRADPPRIRPAWQPHGTVLVTGGTGSIGGHTARWLARRGAPGLVLTSRSGPAAFGAARLAAGLAAAGTTAQIVACDSADSRALTGLLAGDSTGPLTAVFHTAGIPEATAVYDTDPAGLAAAGGAKAAGAALLDGLTAGMGLERFVLFSSVAATWGSALQPGYAAANAYLDALAENRHARGLPATSVAWGPWAGGGMTDAESAGQLRRRGLRPMDPGQAMAALALAVDGGDTQVTVADVDWARFARPFTLRRASPLIESLPEVSAALGGGAAPAAGGASGQGGLARRLAGLPVAGQDELLAELVRAEAAAVLGHASPDAIGTDQAFSDLGADSLTAVELRDRLTAATGTRLPATLLFDYPTPAALARYLRLAVTGGEDAARRPVLAELDRLESLLG
ncbi:MAG TPA: acyltransferase domain-containing protein, partial [Trebonia sp.]